MTLSRIAAGLLEAADEGGVWREFQALEESMRDAVVIELKAEVDRVVRSSPPKALPAADILMRASEATPTQRGLALRGLANALHHNAKYEEAREALEQAAEVYESQGDPRSAATARRTLVDVFMYLGDSSAALAAGDSARAVFESIPDAKDDLARLENNVANVYVRMDEYPLARRHYERAREVFQSTGSTIGIGITSLNLGIVEMNANDVAASEMSLGIAREMFDKLGMDLHVADCDYNLAYLLSRRGRWADAIEGLEEARRTYKRIGKPSGPPLCDLDLAEIYLRIDACRNAAEFADRAARGFDELGLRYESARCGVLAGLALLKLGSPNEALDRLHEAGREFESLGNEAAAAAVEVQRASIELTQGEFEQARARLRSAEEALDRRQLRFLTDLAGVMLARAHLACGDGGHARSLLEGLLARGEENAVFDQLLRADALCLLATARRRQGDAGGATEALREAVEATDQSYGEIPQSDLRVAFFRDRHLAYIELVWDLADSGDPEELSEALRILEESRGRSLREERTRLSGGANLIRARARLDWLLARQVDAELGREEKEHDLRLGAPSHDAIQAAQDQVLAAARQSVGATSLPASLSEEAIADARGPGEVMCFYLVGPRGTRALVVDDQGVHDHPLSITPEEITRLRDRMWLHTDKLRLGSDYVSSRSRTMQSSLDAILDRLGEALLEPLIDRLHGQSVTIVPFGDLHDLPIHACRVDGAALIERCEMMYALSATSLAQARARSSHGSSRVAVGATIPGLDAIDGELRDLAGIHKGLQRLSPDELVTGLEDEQLRGAMLHIAAHAYYQHQRPVFSGVALGERFLLAHDIARIGFPFDLVILSGCETGRRRRIPGEEFRGLTRALLVAGVHATIGSLWAVEDHGTRDYMRTLHRELASGRTLRNAVTNTQRTLLASGHPTTTWAAFAAFGDPGLRLPSNVTSPTTVPLCTD